MRRWGPLAAVLLLLGMSAPAHAAITLVTSTMKASPDNNAVTTDAINTTGATLLVVGITYWAPSGSPTLQDSNTNTWTPAAAATSGDARFALFYCKNPTVGAGHTFTNTTNVSPTIFVVAFAGTDTAADRDQENSANPTGASTKQPGAVTPTTNNQVVVSVFSTDGAGTFSIDGGFTITDQTCTNCGGKLSVGGALAYLIQTTATEANPTWTTTVGATIGAGIDTFKAASAPPSAATTLTGGITWTGGGSLR